MEEKHHPAEQEEEEEETGRNYLVERYILYTLPLEKSRAEDDDEPTKASLELYRVVFLRQIRTTIL